ncbi:unnamed protein product [Timema podura]|uniref:Uncharacterized protein n=1 Tax=Timema podura TaxID=61482 RepID=A0ABN7PNG2_TIMPD|nr:unnamed protein product [Timema podura]
MVVFGRVWRFSGMERWRKSGEAGGGLKALRSSIFFCREGSTTQKINNVHGDVNAVPEQSLQHLGWATAGINPEEFFNITFSEVDTIAALGQFHGLDGKQAQVSATSYTSTLFHSSIKYAVIIFLGASWVTLLSTA